jgi:hypothetical protein
MSTTAASTLLVDRVQGRFRLSKLEIGKHSPPGQRGTAMEEKTCLKLAVV